MDRSRYGLRDGLLEVALAAAHRALQRLDDTDVPAALRPVRAASMRRSLPAPLARTLLRSLEGEWLRRLAFDELADGDSAAHRAAQLYLTRAEGWEAALDHIVETEATLMNRRQTESVVVENERLQRLVEELTRRVSDAESRLRAAEAGGTTGEERIEGLRKRLDIVAGERSDAEARLAQRDAEVERLEGELAEADEKLAQLRGRLGRSGRTTSPDGRSRAFGHGAPLDTARLLDELVEATRPRRVDETVAPVRARLALPHGVAPDSVAAIQWIPTIDRPVMVVVDGHNVAHELGRDPGRTARDRVVSETARLRRLADGPVAAVVFFDSVHAAESHRNFGVSVRYVPDADDAIVAAVAAADIDCIVISTDKEVRARVQEHGAIALWGTAFSDWIARR